MGLVTLDPVTIGVDVGQIHDPTAIAVAEVSQVHTGKYHYTNDEQTLGGLSDKGEWIPPTGVEPVLVSDYIIRSIKRLPLGTSYPDVAVYLAEMLTNALFLRRGVRVLIDVTGVGRPVYDSLRKEIRLRKEARDVWLKPITFSHGEKYNHVTGVVAKAFLVSRLQSLLQGRHVHAPDTAEVRQTLEELRVYEIKVDDDGKDTYGAKIGKHDDLATALGLCCLEDPWGDKVSYSAKRVY